MKNLPSNAYSSFIHNCPNLEKIRCEWIKKLWYNQTMECDLVLKQNDLASPEKTRGNVSAYYKVKEAHLRRLYAM